MWFVSEPYIRLLKRLKYNRLKKLFWKDGWILWEGESVYKRVSSELRAASRIPFTLLFLYCEQLANVRRPACLEGGVSTYSYRIIVRRSGLQDSQWLKCRLAKTSFLSGANVDSTHSLFPCVFVYVCGCMRMWQSVRLVYSVKCLKAELYGLSPIERSS